MRVANSAVSFFALINVALINAVAATAAPTRKPNVLYVFSDMQRASSMGCYGDTNARTPALDTFARQGIRLDAAISPTPVCCPHRANLMSGQYAHHHGMMSNGAPFKPTVKCIAESFRDSGYTTGYVGKWHLGAARESSDPTYGFPPPNTPYGVYQFARDPAPSTEIALKFIAEKSPGREPWMLFVSWIWPHSPYQAPPETLPHFSKTTLPPNVPPGAPREYAKENLPDYYGMIEALDRQFARLLQALDQAGVAEDTIVVYSSDHGDMIGSQGLKAKRWPYEESARVPFLMRYPRRLPVGRVIADPFGTPDVYPTLAGLAGVPVPRGLDGVDFSAFFTGQEAQPPRDYVYLEMHYAYVPWPGWRAIRTRDLMFARTVDQPWLLFDLTKDPWEKNNLVNDPAHQALVKRMDERLAVLMRESGDSWSLRAASGDLGNWLPGAGKQQSQNLGVSYPGQVKSTDNSAGGRKRKKAGKKGDDDGE
jgi:arylsulfatase A-like enzyme